MAAIMPVGPAPAIKTGFKFSFIGFLLLPSNCGYRLVPWLEVLLATVVSARVSRRNVFRDVSLLSKPVFEMFLTLELQLVGTKPYPHDCSSSKYAIRWCNMGAIRQERTLAASR